MTPSPDLAALGRRWGWALALLGLAVAGLALLPVAWIVVVLLYFALVMVPGSALLVALWSRWGARRLDLTEVVFYANIGGLTLLMAIGWSLARFGVFSLWGLTAVLALSTGAGLYLGRHHLVTRWKTWLGRVRSSEGIFVAVCVIASLAMLLPAFLVLRQNFLIGGDSSFFTRVGDVIASSGAWPSLSAVWQPYTSQADLAPGLPVIYATFGPLLGGHAIVLAVEFNMVPFVLEFLGAFLLAREFCTSTQVNWALAMAWGFGYTGQEVFFNNILPAGAPGYYPDGVTSIPFFIAILLCLVRLHRPRPSDSGEIALLSMAFLGAVMLNQLTFLMSVVALVCAALTVSRVRGVRWLLRPALALSVPVLLTLPDYLIPANAAADSPAVSNGQLTHSVLVTFVYPSALSPHGDALYDLGLGILVGGISLAAWTSWRQWRTGIPGSALGSTESRIGLSLASLLILLAAMFSYLSFTDVGAVILGIDSSRFMEFLGILSIPAIGCIATTALGYLARRESRSPNPDAFTRRLRPEGLSRREIVQFSLVVVLLASAGWGARVNLELEMTSFTTGKVFDPYMVDAGNWIAENAPPGTVVVADGNGGNAGLTLLADYAEHIVIYRPRFTLYASITESPYPSNLPDLWANRVLTAPTYANALRASQVLDIEYYVFEQGFSSKEISAFSLLPYFSLDYQNPEIDVFGFNASASGQGVFVPAISYCAASPQVTNISVNTAYNESQSIPLVPNAVSSTTSNGSAFDGSYVTYCLSGAPIGTDALWVHMEVYWPQEYVLVRLNGVLQGAVYFPQSGWSLGAPISISVPSADTNLTLTFEGAVAYSNPLDYLVLTAAPAA